MLETPNLVLKHKTDQLTLKFNSNQIRISNINHTNIEIVINRDNP